MSDIGDRIAEEMAAAMPSATDIEEAIRQGIQGNMPEPSQIIFAIGEGVRLGVRDALTEMDLKATIEGAVWHAARENT